MSSNQAGFPNFVTDIGDLAAMGTTNPLLHRRLQGISVTSCGICPQQLLGEDVLVLFLLYLFRDSLANTCTLYLYRAAFQLNDWNAAVKMWC
jgi:hypothetical protein